MGVRYGHPDDRRKAPTRNPKGRAMATPKRIRWISPAEYAEIHDLHVKTVRRRLKAGQIPGAMQPAPGHAVRIPIADEAA